jgi:predicted MFS family arabinose efflux permease
VTARLVDTFIEGLFTYRGLARLGFSHPAVRDSLGASTSHMGWLIFAIAGGAIFGLVSAGALIGRVGARPVIRAALLTVAASLLAPDSGCSLPTSAYRCGCTSAWPR